MTHSPAPPRRVLTLREGTETLPPVRVRATADPDADHARIRELAMYLSPGPVAAAATAVRSIELADLTLALDAHLAGGGALPQAWRRPPAGPAAVEAFLAGELSRDDSTLAEIAAEAVTIAQAHAETEARAAVAGYLRGYLTAIRAERDWIRAAVTRWEQAGRRVVDGSTGRGGWRLADWRTGTPLAQGHGGQDSLDAYTEQHGWADVNWLAHHADAAADGDTDEWPPDLPPPPPPAGTLETSPALAIPGLPDSLTWRWRSILDEWATSPAEEPERTAEVAALTGWTVDQVRACTASYVTTPGDEFMRLGEA
jgi:hypothetical protein